MDEREWGVQFPDQVYITPSEGMARAISGEYDPGVYPVVSRKVGPWERDNEC